MSLLLANLNSLAGGLFLITAFGIIATRQVQDCLRFFIFQSIFLAASAFVLGAQPLSWHLIAAGAINLVTKPLLIPWVLRRTVHEEIYTRREINQILSIPISLMIALILAVAAYFISLPWLGAVGADGAVRINVPIGLAGVLLGAYGLTVRREAVPQILGILGMENGAFFAGVAITPDLPVIAELAVAFDILVLAFVVGVLTRTVHERTGTTAVGNLTNLREEPRQ
jgi:hydrogenase-4 component E